MFGRQLPPMPTAQTALPGRDERPFEVPSTHAVLGTPLEGPWPEGTQVLHVAMGCYWGVERIFWQLPGVVTTFASLRILSNACQLVIPLGVFTQRYGAFTPPKTFKPALRVPSRSTFALPR